VRYLGPERASTLVLARRPEAVASAGRVQAWLIGSGTDHASFSDPLAEEAMGQGLPVVLDGGALELHRRRRGPVVITPHYRELARVLDLTPGKVAADPEHWARYAAEKLQVSVLLKGHTTYVAGPDGQLRVKSAPTWLATAGAGDALAGILGALVATHSTEIQADDGMLARLAATAAVIHGRAAHRASRGGPLTILDLCEAIPATIGELLTR
jgi:ADP-dependent NAD(P)H-hydrate dehydratase / NAD(P)H-hydrate epimerase